MDGHGALSLEGFSSWRIRKLGITKPGIRKLDNFQNRPDIETVNRMTGII
jgi:hypothetical protein